MKYAIGLCVFTFVLSLMTIPVDAQKAKLFTKDNVLVGANFNDGPGSSDMTLIMRLSGDGKVFLDEGHEVKYIHDPDNQNVKGDWTAIDFDDKDWEDGLSGVGFSDGDDNTEVPAGRISIWTRYRFDAPDAKSVKELVLLSDFDDQFIAWLNGVEIARSPSAPGAVGDIPAWDASQGGIANRGSAELPKGKPNKDRWNHGSIQKNVIQFEFGGDSALFVEAQGKLATIWGKLKAVR